jgi:hypothetical protein
MELTTINKLYLELSQIATARTSKDLEIERQRIIIRRRGKLIQDIFNCAEVEALSSDLKVRMSNELL